MDEIPKDTIISALSAAVATRLLLSLPDSVGESTGGIVEGQCLRVTEKQTDLLAVAHPIFSSTIQKNSTHVS